MLSAFFHKLWYQKPWFIVAILLWPLSALYYVLATLKKYQDTKKQLPLATPLVVVGNITVGGTGKTPLVIAMVTFLQQQGLNVSVISRGFGGKATYPYRLHAKTQSHECGDEPLLIYQSTGCDVVVDPIRNRGINLLQQQNPDVIISDDGLQHYAMSRSIEIAVVDGKRLLGNGWLLPAGPLREGPKRLKNVDFVVYNGGHTPSHLPKGTLMQLEPAPLQALPFTQGAAPKAHDSIHAVAGIGNPGRFFASLQDLQFKVQCHAFADHHSFQEHELIFNDAKAVVMTAKDAVKCQGMPQLTKHWYLPVEAKLDEAFWQALLETINQKRQACHS